MMTPVLTDRHGFLIYKGNTVEKIVDNSRFVVSEVMRTDTSPVSKMAPVVLSMPLWSCSQTKKRIETHGRGPTFARYASTITSTELPGSSRLLDPTRNLRIPRVRPILSI